MKEIRVPCCSSSPLEKENVMLPDKLEFSQSFFGKLFCYGFASSLFIFVTVNMSMVLGLLPIVGSPLPIMSYGGSSMMAIMLGLGIAMSCKVYKDTPVN